MRNYLKKHEVIILVLLILLIFMFILGCSDKSDNSSDGQNTDNLNGNDTTENGSSSNNPNKNGFTLTVKKSPPNAPAKIIVEPDKKLYQKGEEVTIYVLTVEDIFLGWEGDLSGIYKDKQGNIRDYPGKITMNSDKTIIARFKPAPDEER